MDKLLCNFQLPVKKYRTSSFIFSSSTILKKVRELNEYVTFNVPFYLSLGTYATGIQTFRAVNGYYLIVKPCLQWLQPIMIHRDVHYITSIYQLHYFSLILKGTKFKQASVWYGFILVDLFNAQNFLYFILVYVFGILIRGVC